MINIPIDEKINTFIEVSGCTCLAPISYGRRLVLLVCKSTENEGSIQGLVCLVKRYAFK